MTNPREFQDCRDCHKLGRHTLKAGCAGAEQAVGDALADFLTDHGLSGVQFGDGPEMSVDDLRTPVGRDNDGVVTPSVLDRATALIVEVFDTQFVPSPLASKVAQAQARKAAQRLAEEGLLILDQLPYEDENTLPVGSFLDGLAAGGMEFAEDDDEYVDEDIHRGER